MRDSEHCGKLATISRVILLCPLKHMAPQRVHADVLASRYGDLYASEARYRPADASETRRLDGRIRKPGTSDCLIK